MALPDNAAIQLASTGYVVLPSAFTGPTLSQLIARYDEAMAGPVDRSSRQQARRIGCPTFSVRIPCSRKYFPFQGSSRLSSLVARTLRAGTPAQALHADLPRDDAD